MAVDRVRENASRDGRMLIYRLEGQWLVPISKAFTACAILVCTNSNALALDCLKAISKIDKAICADVGLKTEDASLSRTYFDTLKASSGTKHGMLIDDQRQWLKRRDRECSIASVQTKDCLAKSMKDREVQIRICFAGTSVEGSNKNVLCPVAIHATCPEFSVRAAAGISAYPSLVAIVQKLVEQSKLDANDKDTCAAEDADHPGSPDENKLDYSISIIGIGKSWATIKEVEESSYRDPLARSTYYESVVTYDPISGKKLSIEDLLSGMSADATAADQLEYAVSERLDVPCCGDKKVESLGELNGIRSDHLPNAWSIEDNGDLTLFYDYTSLGHFFVARSTIKPDVVLDWVDPTFRTLFTQSVRPQVRPHR